MTNRVSNPFVTYDDGTSQYAGPHGGLKAQFDVGQGSPIAAAGAFRLNDYSFGPLMRGRKFGPHQNFGGGYDSFGSHRNLLPNGPNSNNVRIAPSCGFGRELGPSGAGAFNESGSFILW